MKEATDFLFDVSRYSNRSRRTLPLRPPARSRMSQEVWAALVRVKRALDDAGREKREPTGR